MADDNQRSGPESQIDENLKRVFQQTLDEDLPDRFKDLLEQLRQKDRTNNGGGSS